MSTSSATLTVRGIDVEIVFKDIKNLHIGVYPPSGRVRAAAPRRLDEDRVRLAVIQRLPWIKQQRQQFLDAARQSEREMTSGETHYVWGSRLRLRVIERPGRAHIETDHDRLLLYVAWSRFRFGRFAGDERAGTTLALLAECFEVLGGVPGKVLADRMGCLKGGVVADVVVPTGQICAVRCALRVPAGLLPGCGPRNRRVSWRTWSATPSAT